MSAAPGALGFLRDLFPSRSDYRGLRRSWRSDLLAGLTVGIVALPLALGFAVSSGLSAGHGLVTAIVAGALAAVFGGSHVQVSGPTGAMVVVLLPIVAAHGPAAVALVAILAGLIVMAAGFLRLGRAIAVIPWPVIEGFTLGIAAIIFLQQIPSLTSASPAGAAEHSSNALVAAVQAVAAADWAYTAWAAGAAAVVVACMVLTKRMSPAVPGSLVGVALVTVLCVLLPTPLAAIGAVPDSLPTPSLPSFTLGELGGLLAPAVAVAALAGIESLLSARVAASLEDTGPYNPDRELVGQGIASVGAGVFGGMPATGAIARTAVNVRSGARSRLAAVTHAGVLLAVVLVASGPVGMIPLAALAGVLMFTAWQMVSASTTGSILRSTRADATAFVLTALVTVSFDLVVAVVIGIVVAGVFAVRNLSLATGTVQEPLPGPTVPGDERIALVRFDGPLIFASADRVFGAVTDVNDVSVVVLRLSRIGHIDATGAHALTGIVQTLERRGITVLVKGVQSHHESLLRTVGVQASLRHHKHLFTDLDAAVAHARSHVERERAA